MLAKGPAYQFDLSLIRLAFYFPGMKQEVDELYFLLYQENINLHSWKYKLYDIKDNQVKDRKIFSPKTQFKFFHRKVLSLKILEKQKNAMLL